MDEAKQFNKLSDAFEGEVITGEAYRLMYATDASAYREVPAAVVLPKNTEDIKRLVRFAGDHGFSIIPRGAGTSLAGQVVGNGIVADISRHMNQVIELNKEERWVRVQPGVVLEEMNILLEKEGLFFGPETSTANRCMIGGMVGNNACGAHSLIYGSTRDHTISVKAILSDGSEAEFIQLSKEEFLQKLQGDNLESRIYGQVNEILADPVNQQEIRKEFPDRQIKRRNTGYAIDLLLDCVPFAPDGEPFNFSRILAGSEGTLAFITEVKLNLVPLPSGKKALMCIHFDSLPGALKGNLEVLKHKPGAIELMDKYVLDCTKNNLEQKKNRFFIQGDPAAILIIEMTADTQESLDKKMEGLKEALNGLGLGYHYPVIKSNDMARVWSLRKAGLGVLSNIPGDAKPVSVVEDTAILPERLPEYIADFQLLMEKYKLRAVYHAHIATGELHLRPVLNLKDPGDVALFRTIGAEVATLVKKYNGSLSGEHGDGRLRGEFIPLMIGPRNYKLLESIKQTWDPFNVFNPGKITATPVMNTSLRYEPGQETKEISTYFDFSGDQGIARAAEKCNGSGDCRKSEIIGGTMCPSFMATRDESTTTRARANILREFLGRPGHKNPFNHSEIYEVMDLCLGCKGCVSECPSSVDMTRYKTEFLQHYYDANGIPLRTFMIANISRINKLGSLFPKFYNFLITSKYSSALLKKLMGFASPRSLPLLYKKTLRAWARIYLDDRRNGTGRHSHAGTDQHSPSGPDQHSNTGPIVRKVYLFADEFTEYQDVELGIKAIKLLTALGYSVEIPKHTESGRTFLSKGLVKKAKKIAEKNVEGLTDLVNSDTPLVGIEPSGILSFRDEYPALVSKELMQKARSLAENCLLIDEFLAREAELGHITKDQFTRENKHIKVHGHCHQKSLASIDPTLKLLSIPENYTVEEIKSGCCGMAGAFGFEKEHYDLSMKVGELVLFPAVRATDKHVLIAAPGTSSRQQISDGTGSTALHPVEILYDALL